MGKSAPPSQAPAIANFRQPNTPEKRIKRFRTELLVLFKQT